MQVSLAKKMKRRNATESAHTRFMHWMMGVRACDCLCFQAHERGGPVSALLLDNVSSGNKLLQLTFPRDPRCWM